jgi:CBS domain-containing protein
MLTDTWKRGVDLSEITSQAAGMKLPTVAVATNETVQRLVNVVLKNNVDSVLITDSGDPVGIINYRDILKELVESHKDPAKTLTKDLDYTPLLTLDKDQTMTDALRLIQGRKIKRIAVVKDGQLMGMLTQNLPVPIATPVVGAAKK